MTLSKLVQRLRLHTRFHEVPNLCPHVCFLNAITENCNLITFLDLLQPDRLVFKIRDNAIEQCLQLESDRIFIKGVETAAGFEPTFTNMKKLHQPGMGVIHKDRRESKMEKMINNESRK